MPQVRHHDAAHGNEGLADWRTRARRVPTVHNEGGGRIGFVWSAQGLNHRRIRAGELQIPPSNSIQTTRTMCLSGTPCAMRAVHGEPPGWNTVCHGGDPPWNTGVEHGAPESWFTVNHGGGTPHAMAVVDRGPRAVEHRGPWSLSTSTGAGGVEHRAPRAWFTVDRGTGTPRGMHTVQGGTPCAAGPAWSGWFHRTLSGRNGGASCHSRGLGPERAAPPGSLVVT